MYYGLNLYQLFKIIQFILKYNTQRMLALQLEETKKVKIELKDNKET